ncbi:hypothetical protein FJY71_09895, partial [candidate division WOR-3 bacterium]|nr:hypothetical protein [candidate division WOR-3 bacterium]
MRSRSRRGSACRPSTCSPILRDCDGRWRNCGRSRADATGTTAMTDTGFIVSGRAGQGVQVISQVLGRVLVRAGYHVLVTQDVMSRIRGGHNFSRVRVGDGPVAADRDRARLLLALDKELVAPHSEELDPDAVLIVDDEDGTCIRA